MIEAKLYVNWNWNDYKYWSVNVCLLQDLVRNISSAEVIITRAQSLLSKFTQVTNDASELHSTDLHGFVSDLLEQPEVNIIGASRAPLGVIVHQLFVASHKVHMRLV